MIESLCLYLSTYVLATACSFHGIKCRGLDFADLTIVLSKTALILCDKQTNDLLLAV